MTSVLRREENENGKTRREEGHVKAETEIGQGLLATPEAGRSNEGFSSGL